MPKKIKKIKIKYSNIRLEKRGERFSREGGLMEGDIKWGKT